jgi:putative tryptophan/tyrosine transport system substrate-binding protein
MRGKEDTTGFRVVDLRREPPYRSGMDRRRLILSAVAATLAPRAVAAQSPALRRIGFIANAPRTPVTDTFWDALVEGLRERGWVESQNLAIDRRYVDPRTDDGSAAVEALLGAKVEVIVVSATRTALAAKRLTRTVPIVMTVPADPVAVGLVDSLARPGGNVTGLSFVGTEVAGKQVELLKEAVGGLASLAVLANPENASHAPRAREILAAGRALRLQVDVVEARTREQLTEAFGAMARRKAGAAIVLADPTFVRDADTVIRLAAEHRLPVMYGLREAPLLGGLMSYGPSFVDQFRRASGYVDRILKGAQPRDLPVEQASRFELVVNLRTAKALGLTLPPTFLVRADQVIE